MFCREKLVHVCMNNYERQGLVWKSELESAAPLIYIGFAIKMEKKCSMAKFYQVMNILEQVNGLAF